MQCQKLKTYMETGRVMFLPARAIRPNPAQPRKVFQEDALSELADSIRQHGILQPLSVRRMGTGYELIAGERRLRAAQMAHLSEIPCIVNEKLFYCTISCPIQKKVVTLHNQIHSYSLSYGTTY